MLTVALLLAVLCVHAQLLEEGNPQLMRINITISHSSGSSLPAFILTVEKELPTFLTLVKSSLTSDVDISIMSRNTSLILLAHRDVFPVTSSITIAFLSQVDWNLPPLQPLLHNLTVTYYSIQQEEGIGMQVNWFHYLLSICLPKG